MFGPQNSIKIQKFSPNFPKIGKIPKIAIFAQNRQNSDFLPRKKNWGQFQIFPKFPKFPPFIFWVEKRRFWENLGVEPPGGAKRQKIWGEKSSILGQKKKEKKKKNQEFWGENLEF